jgi:hypothetical protein
MSVARMPQFYRFAASFARALADRLEVCAADGAGAARVVPLGRHGMQGHSEYVAAWSGSGRTLVFSRDTPDGPRQAVLDVETGTLLGGRAGLVGPTVGDRARACANFTSALTWANAGCLTCVELALRQFPTFDQGSDQHVGCPVRYVRMCAPGRVGKASATIADLRKHSPVEIEYRYVLPPR